ncbi:MAG: peptidylprolyl isomerase [Bacteroidetes bacterium]|jgi:peptidylprolyl isomerase/peptidyl-prolyl cis-trans isomerase D|nr:peptidylprolyl isomerase [Bacteroidota bacterium]
MGTMTNIRENTGIILWILVFAFGVIWVLQDSGGVDVISGTSASNLIVVDGESISHQEYREALDQRLEMYRQQTGEQVSAQRRDIEEQRTFEGLVEDRLIKHEMDRLGITVSDEELYDMVMGDNPHPVIVANFGDEQGNIDRSMIQNVVDNMDQDPQLREQWLQLEDFLRQERRQQKLVTLLESSVRISPADVQMAHTREHLRADAEYVALRYAALPNDSVDVTESDIRAFYDAHREDYRRERSYEFQYASLPKVPAPEDTTAFLEDLEDMKESFAASEDPGDFLQRNASTRQLTDAFFALTDLANPIATAIAEQMEPGAVVGPVVANNQVNLIKIRDLQPADEASVRARHILISANGDNADAQAEAAALATELRDGADFAALAREHSDDPGSAARGGDLGWFDRGTMVGPFESAAFGATPGEIVGPVETEFGYHVIEVQQRVDQEVQVAIYAQNLTPSVATLREIEDTLEDLRIFTDEGADFEEEAERLGLELQTVRVEEGQENIPNIGQSPTLQSFLEDSARGDVTETIELDDKMIVGRVTGIQSAGYRPFEEVRDAVEPRAILQAKRAVQTERMQRAYDAQGFDGLAEALDTNVRTASNISYENTNVPGLGREITFAGQLLGLDVGDETGVTEGENGVWVARVTRKADLPELTEQRRAQLRQRLEQERVRELQQAWVESLRADAAITDNRSRILMQ